MLDADLFRQIPQRAGIGLKAQHIQDVLHNKPRHVGWFEVHCENYMGLPLEAPAHKNLHRVRADYPLSFHGVGLSLGSAEGLCEEHLSLLRDVIQMYEPGLVSEHLSWSRQGEAFLNDLLPLPYNDESLTLLIENVQKVQEYLGREILIENPSRYLELAGSDREEADFLAELCQRSGARVLLDVNNIFVSCVNLGQDPKTYIQKIPPHFIDEIHVADHAAQELVPGERILIDDHSGRPSQEVWSLYEFTLDYAQSPVPTLIEWDTDVPPLSTLLEEARRINEALSVQRVRHAATL